MITDIRDMTSFKWATVTGIAPVEIRLDGDTNPLALIPDSLVDPLLLAPGDRVRVEMSLRKVVIHGVSNGVAIPLGDSGDIKITARAVAPDGWLLCQGQSLLRSSYPDLFTAIGTTYGSVSGSYFTIPNLSGKAVIGYDTTQTEFDALGKVGGEKTHLLTIAEMPSHRHTVSNIGVGGFPPGSGVNAYYPSGANSDTGLAGGDAAHNNMPPYIVLNYVIKI